MLVNRRLNPGSQKDTRHFELDLTGWGLSYEVGDSMAIYPSNDPMLVDEVLQALGASGAEIVPSTTKGETVPLREALLRQYSITQPTPKLLKAIAQRASGAPLLNELLRADRKADLENYLWGMEVIDFLRQHRSIHFAPEEFVTLLSKLQPRLYSIASSLKAFPDQVHFMIDIVRYESHGRERNGVCSSFWPTARTTGPCRSSSDLEVPHAGRPGPDDHGRARHRRRAVPRLPAGASGDRRAREIVALLRGAE